MNTGFILTLAYPETIVMVADEWYSDYMRFFGIGKKNYVRAGHAALVLIHKATGTLEYHDFGRYITPQPFGRVRGKDTDHELHIPLKASIENDRITNLEDILTYFASHPKLTHGDGSMYASVCNAIHYDKAKTHITKMQNQHFIRYAAFVKDASNCARFVTDAVLAGITDAGIEKKLLRSKWFTPSTIGTIVIATTEKEVYHVTEAGAIGLFESSVKKLNRRLFLDCLKDHHPNFEGTLLPRHHELKSDHAQWLSGIAAGAWFELYDLNHDHEYRFRRLSPYGHLDVDGVYHIGQNGFDIKLAYQFIPYSNCSFFHIQQEGSTFRFDFLRNFSGLNSMQTAHST